MFIDELDKSLANRELAIFKSMSDEDIKNPQSEKRQEYERINKLRMDRRNTLHQTNPQIRQKIDKSYQTLEKLAFLIKSMHDERSRH
jgi:hypothetical protein